MPNFKEAIEDRIGPVPGYIDTSENLSTYYSQNTLACHGIRPLDATRIEAFFIVPDELCGPTARPPMFDKIQINGDNAEVETGDGDAKDHFIDTVVINGSVVKLVPGHNLAGLVVETMNQMMNIDRVDPVNLMLTGSARITYNGFVLPHQRISLEGPAIKEESGIIYSPDVKSYGKVRSKAMRFQCEIADPIDEEIKSQMMAQHWLWETTAQGFGSAVSLNRPADGQVPILMQSEKTVLSKSPIKKGDLIVTRFELTPSPIEQGFGHSEIYVNGNLYGTQRRLMVMFYPLEKIAEGIELARKDQAA